MRTDSPEIITIYGSGPVAHQSIFGFQPSTTRQGNSSGAASPTLTAAGSHTHTSGGLQEARSDCPTKRRKWDSLEPGFPIRHSARGFSRCPSARSHARVPGAAVRGRRKRQSGRTLRTSIISPTFSGVRSPTSRPLSSRMSSAGAFD
jgi:hypothetical protein